MFKEYYCKGVATIALMEKNSKDHPSSKRRQGLRSTLVHERPPVGNHPYKKDALQFTRGGHVQMGSDIGFCRVASGEHLTCCSACEQANEVEWVRVVSFALERVALK